MLERGERPGQAIRDVLAASRRSSSATLSTLWWTDQHCDGRVDQHYRSRHRRLCLQHRTGGFVQLNGAQVGQVSTRASRSVCAL
jgi:hypothetical protein